MAEILALHEDALNKSVGPLIDSLALCYPDAYSKQSGGSLGLGLETLHALRRLVYLLEEWDNSCSRDVLLHHLREAGRRLAAAAPVESVPANVVRRVLKLLREEASRIQCSSADGDLLADAPQNALFADNSEGMVTSMVPQPDWTTLRDGFLAQLEEYQVEIENAHENIAVQALDHIHAEEVVLTLGRSRTVESFLVAAHSKRSFQVIVAESGGHACHAGDGAEQAAALARAGLKVTLITDAQVFALMARVNTCIVGTHSVLADGSLKARVGLHGLALAARRYSVPVLVCAPLFKLAPAFRLSADENVRVAPAALLPGWTHIERNGAADGEQLRVHNTQFERVPAHLVTLFVTNGGGHAPSYLYRLISEFYHPEDHELVGGGVVGAGAP